jgi:colanic acid/amylovoran biosynthesis glycosyltransferase
VGDRKNLTIAYIVSMPHGLDAWTYREIDALTEDNMGIIIFPIRYASGPYMPKRSWECYRYSKWKVILVQAMLIAGHPGRYLGLLREAVQTHTLADLVLAADFARVIENRGVELIHCVFGDHKLFVGYYCKKMLDMPLSVALYGYDLRVNPNWPMFRRAIKSADTIIANCEFNKNLLEEMLGDETAGRVKVIRHYADIGPWDGEKRISILVVGGFVARKGHDVLFRALSALGSEADGLEVWVAGYDGPIDVVGLAEKCGVEDKVRVFGSVSDEVLKLLYEKCDLFCLPSRTDAQGVSEGLPVALIEAMANAKPVIATRIGGTGELVREILVEENDVLGLARAIKRFKDDRGFRLSSGARNREIVEQEYSRKNVGAMKNLWIEDLRRRLRVAG